MPNIADVSDATFQSEVLQSHDPVLVDFWALWCEPCRAVAPIIHELAKNYEGRLKVVKMNVDENKRTPARYGVRGIPAVLLFKNGKIAHQIVGYVAKDKIDQSITEILAG